MPVLSRCLISISWGLKEKSKCLKLFPEHSGKFLSLFFSHSHYFFILILTYIQINTGQHLHVSIETHGEGNGTPLQYSCLENPMDRGAWWAAVHGVAKSRTWLSDFTFTFHLHALEKEMATHSSGLAWRIPGTGEPGGLPSMGSRRVGHNWSDLAAAAASSQAALSAVTTILNFLFNIICFEIVIFERLQWYQTIHSLLGLVFFF